MLAALRNFKHFIQVRLDLRSDKEDSSIIVDNIKSGVEFKGTNLWILIFAVFVASLGLNMNSIPVIIGAMLISPLMGPIMGVGLGVATLDNELLFKSLKNLGIATLFGMLTSALYFLISPIDEARSELLARTTPTIYDVLIALFGGMAGIIATGSKEKGNVIPGVAIATALMPPLCTSGYGLATAHWNYFFGAFYLYLINCVYIGFATWIGVKILKIPYALKIDDKDRKKIIVWTASFVLVTALPSIYITYRIIEDNILNAHINNFVSDEFSSASTQVLNKKLIKENDGKKLLEISLIGQSISQDSLNIIRLKMPFYGLGDIGLRVVQGYSPDAYTDQKELTTTIMQDLLSNNQAQLKDQMNFITRLENELLDCQRLDSTSIFIGPELKVLFPQVVEIGIARTMINNVESNRTKEITFALIEVDEPISTEQKTKLKEWLKARTNSNDLELIEK